MTINKIPSKSLEHNIDSILSFQEQAGKKVVASTTTLSTIKRVNNTATINKKLVYRTYNTNMHTETKTIISQKESCILDIKTFYCCGICNEKFVSKMDRINHSISQHNGRSYTPSLDKEKIEFEQSVLNTSPNSDNNKKSYPCYRCKITFDNIKKIKNHILTIHSKEIDVHSCIHCQLKFTSYIKLKNHLLNEHNENFKCEHCPSSFINNFQLARHQENTHNVNHRYKCTVCNKTFLYSHNLKFHRDAAHHFIDQAIDDNVTMKQKNSRHQY